MTYKTRDGAYPSVKINVLNELPADRLLVALQRLRKAIAEGRALRYYDDTTPGDKSTSCSWGLCHDSAETWPDAQDHTFPVDFEQRGRISTLDTGHRCPLDFDPAYKNGGCFWTCRVFQANRQRPVPTKAEVLAMYDEKIKRLT